MKKQMMASLICSALLLSSALPAGTAQMLCTAAEESADAPEFVIEDGVLCSVKNCKGNIVIPEGVTHIGTSAFEKHTDMSAVTIPDTVTEIGDYAFAGCTGLTSIVIPDSVTAIGASAFQSCKNLESVTLPTGITELKDYTFMRCDSLREINIPESVVSIGCYTLPSYSPWADAMRETDPLIVVNDIVVDGTKCDGDIVIPDGTRSIVPCAFLNSTITSVAFPDTLERIGGAAFMSCTALRAIHLPDSMRVLGNSVFVGCTSLEEVTLPAFLEEIGSSVFIDTPWLEAQREKDPLVVVGDCLIDGVACEGDVVIPNTVTKIQDQAFYQCKGITSVDIPDSVTSIGYRAFGECRALTTVTMADSVETMGTQVFWNCSSLQNVTLSGSLKRLPSYTFDGCAALTTLTIPEGIEVIGDYAFEVSGLTEITFPESLTTVENGAFFNCSQLGSVVFPKSVSSIGVDLFMYCTKLETVTIENPYCTIYDKDASIANGKDGEGTYVFSGSIYGYTDSTAQAYADKYGRTFVSIGEMPESLCGDVNWDGVFNVSDVVLLQKWLLAVPDTHLSNWKTADLCEDGKLDVFDLCMMKRLLLDSQ